MPNVRLFCSDGLCWRLECTFWKFKLCNDSIFVYVKFSVWTFSSFCSYKLILKFCKQNKIRFRKKTKSKTVWGENVVLLLTRVFLFLFLNIAIILNNLYCIEFMQDHANIIIFFLSTRLHGFLDFNVGPAVSFGPHLLRLPNSIIRLSV